MTIGKKKKARSFGDLHCDEVLCGERLCDEAQRRSRRNPFTKGRRKLHFWPWRNKREKASPTGLSFKGFSIFQLPSFCVFDMLFIVLRNIYICNDF